MIKGSENVQIRIVYIIQTNVFVVLLSPIVI